MKRKKIKNIEARETNGQKWFSTRQVLDLFNLKAGRLRQWVKLGYIIPPIPAERSGSTNYYSIRTLYRIGIFMKLCNAGFNRYISSSLTNEIYTTIYLDHFDYDKIINVVIEWKGEREKDKNYWRQNIRIYMADESMLDLTEVQMALVLNLSQIVEDIDRKVSL